MKVIKLSFLIFMTIQNTESQFNNAFNSAYSTSMMKKQPSSLSSFYFQNSNNQARSERPQTSRYNLWMQPQTQSSNNAIMQRNSQLRSQYGVNYSSPNSRISFTPTSQQQVTNSNFLTANDITGQNLPRNQFAQNAQQNNFNIVPSKGQIQIGQPQNFSQQIQNQNLQNQITPDQLTLVNQLSFDFNSSQAQQALLNQQQQQAQNQPQQQPLMNQALQQQQSNQADLLALVQQQLQNQQGQNIAQQPQQQAQQISNPGANNLDPEQQQLQLLLKQLQQNQQPQNAAAQTQPQQTQQENVQKKRPAQQPQKKRPPAQQDDEEDILSQFFDQQEDGSLDDFFGAKEEEQPKKKRPRPKQEFDPDLDPPKSDPKPSKSSSSSGDINLFELFNNQGSSNSIGDSELQGEVVHYIDDPSQLNSSEPEVTSIDQFLQAGEVPGGGMPF